MEIGKAYWYYAHGAWIVATYLGTKINEWSGKVYHRFMLKSKQEILLTQKQTETYIQ